MPKHYGNTSFYNEGFTTDKKRKIHVSGIFWSRSNFPILFADRIHGWVPCVGYCWKTVGKNPERPWYLPMVLQKGVMAHIRPHLSLSGHTIGYLLVIVTLFSLNHLSMSTVDLNRP